MRCQGGPAGKERVHDVHTIGSDKGSRFKSDVDGIASAVFVSVKYDSGNDLCWVVQGAIDERDLLGSKSGACVDMEVQLASADRQPIVPDFLGLMTLGCHGDGRGGLLGEKAEVHDVFLFGLFLCTL